MELVELAGFVPGAIIDMRYTGERNIMGRPISDEQRPRLTPAAAAALQAVAEDLQSQGYRLVIWDAYRTPEVQQLLLGDVQDQRYVLLESKHCLGLAVDCTVATADGDLLDMGTDHDDFSYKAHVDTSDITDAQQQNRHILLSTMQRHGFAQWPYEWWHFDFTP